MTELPVDELAALDRCYLRPGTSLLELGNKKNRTGLYRDWYVKQDILEQFRKIEFGGSHGRAQTITNFGFTEHVGETLQEQLECWRNIHELLQYNGTLAICMPIMPDWKGHGRWMPTPDWYDEMASLNGYDVLFTCIWQRVRPTFVATMVKRGRDPWIAPADSEILRSDK